MDSIPKIEKRIHILHELEVFYQDISPNDQTCNTLIDKILFQLTKFDPLYCGSLDIELISSQETIPIQKVYFYFLNSVIFNKIKLKRQLCQDFFIIQQRFKKEDRIEQ